MTGYFIPGYTPPVGVTDGEGVRRLQRQLNAQGASLQVDGVWGPKSQAAYQAQQGPATAVSQLTGGLGAFMQGIQSLLQTPALSYTPQSTASLRAQLASSLRPGVDQAIERRKELTEENRAELDADAWARGMGRSTYVTDMKDRQMDAEADDIAQMEAQYSATLAQLLMEAVERERARALEVQMYNANRQAETRQLAFSTAQSAYADYIAQLQAAQKKSGGSAKEYARITTPENCMRFLAGLTGAQRGNIYKGATAQDRVYRDELIASLGEAGYLQVQTIYPGA